MAYNLREKRPVSYAEKPLFVLPRKKKTKKCDEKLYPVEIVERDDESKRYV